jgi:hypothetical protein
VVVGKITSVSLSVAQLVALDPLLLPLAAPQRVLVISNKKLREKLEKNVALGAKSNLSELGWVDGWQHVVPAQLLLELAEASTPPLIPPGLRDISLRWAWLRYCWAFEPPTGPKPKLRLSQAAWRLAQHHKQVSADQLGVGFALDMTRRALEIRYNAWTKVHDADVVIDGGGLSAWGFSQGADLRPDYFIEVFIVPPPQAAKPYTKIYLLECKGTHSGIHMSQLRKGLRQVMSVVDHDGKSLPSVVSSAGFTEMLTTLRIIDPDDDADGYVAMSADRDARAQFTPREGGGVVIHGAAELRRELAQLDQAQTLAFAGLYAQAHDALPPRLRERDVAPIRDELSDQTPVARAAFGRPAAGTEFVLPLVDGRQLRAACVVDDEILTAARGQSPVEMRRARQRFSDAVETSRSDAPRDSDDVTRRGSWLESDGPEHLRVVSRDGSIIDLSAG